MGNNAKKTTKKTPIKSSTSATSVAKKESGKPTKGAKPLVKTLVKAVQKVLTKPVKTTPAAKAVVKAKATSLVPSEARAPKELKKDSKKPKKAKKQEDELDLGDDLIGDDGLGAEEIPDLAEFEETEIDDADDTELEVSEGVADAPVRSGDEEVVLTDAEGRRYCRVRDCDQISAVEGYCRFHYLQLWKKIQVRRKILTDGKLQRYVEELTSRYPDKFLEMIRKDLRNEKDFLTAIAELEIDESAMDNEFEDEAQNFIDEVRGISEGSSISDEQDDF